MRRAVRAFWSRPTVTTPDSRPHLIPAVSGRRAFSASLPRARRRLYPSSRSLAALRAGLEVGQFVPTLSRGPALAGLDGGLPLRSIVPEHDVGDRNVELAP